MKSKKLTDKQVWDVCYWLNHPVWFIDTNDNMPTPFCYAEYGHSYICPRCNHEVEWYMTGEVAKWRCDCD